MAEITGFTRRLVIRGGPGSGHKKHKGIPGHRGGSQKTYPEGMAPSDQPKGKWRTMSDEDLALQLVTHVGGQKDVAVPAAFSSTEQSLKLLQHIRGGPEWLSPFGNRIGADAQGSFQSDAMMERIKEFYVANLVEGHGMDALGLARSIGDALEVAGRGVQMSDRARESVLAASRYFLNLSSKQAWNENKLPEMADEDAQFYVLHELIAGLNYMDLEGKLFDRDGGRNKKTAIAKFIAGNGKEKEAFNELMDMMAEHKTEDYQWRNPKKEKAAFTAIEQQVEKKLVEKADVIEAAFAYAETEGEKLRTSLLEHTMGGQEGLAGLKEAVKTAESRETVALGVYHAKQAELNEAADNSAEGREARAIFDAPSFPEGMSHEEYESLSAKRTEAYQTLSRLSNEADDELHKTDEWFRLAQARDEASEARKEWENGLEEQKSLARDFIVENGFGSEANNIEGTIVKPLGGRGLGAAELARATDRHEEAREWLEKMVASEVISDRQLNYNGKKVARGSQSGEQYNLSPGSGVEYHVHEAAHWLEEYNDSIHSQAVAFLRYRNKGETYLRMSAARNRAKKLRDQGVLKTSSGLWSGGFKAHEIAAVDRWRDPYAGKKYGAEYYATEVLSMGLQWMYDNPVAFAEEDPEHFNFTLAMIAGAK
jgi:hypothetical protein